MEAASRASFRIAGTPFGTITINRNVAVEVHRDTGGYAPEGLGVMACFRRGHYEGGQLRFPTTGEEVDLEDRDVVFFDPGLLHGVAALAGAREGRERITAFAGLGEPFPLRYRDAGIRGPR